MTNWLGGLQRGTAPGRGRETGMGWMQFVQPLPRRKNKAERKQSADEVSLLLSTTLEHWQRAVGLQPRAKLERGAWLVPVAGLSFAPGQR
jgi:hypothetical protein